MFDNQKNFQKKNGCLFVNSITIKRNFWRKRRIRYDTNIQSNEESKRQFEIIINQLNQINKKLQKILIKLKKKINLFMKKLLNNYQEEEKERCEYYNSPI